MDLLHVSEITFYIVEIFALPFAIAVFIYEQRKERRNEAEEIYQRLSDEYREFLKLVLDNADLHLLRGRSPLATKRRKKLAMTAANISRAPIGAVHGCSGVFVFFVPFCGQ
jgi:hypothetical protein